MRLRSATLLVALAACRPVAGQVIPIYDVMYRPPGVAYEVVRTRHFDMIYQRGAGDDARRLASVLESALDRARRILPVGDGFRMPVVVNAFSDRGNGYVRTVPFRQEVESASLKSRTLSPRHSSWLATVGPHELVHAVHGDFDPGFGLGWLLRPFAPDVARSLNFWAPPGIAEGAAVYLESTFEEGAGRLRHPFFLAPFRAAVGTGGPWTLAQALEAPTFTRPTDRYYVGGSAFFAWLVRRYGPNAFRRVTSAHNRFPLFGYGFSLWLGTGRAPWTLGRQFRRDAAIEERARAASLGTLTPYRLIAGAGGRLHRRPRYLKDGSIVAYRTAYDRRRGLYRFDPATSRDEALSYQDLTDDFQLSVTPAGDEVLFARDHPDPWSPLQSNADLHALRLADGHTRRITTGRHLLAPVVAPDGGYWAVRVDGGRTSWVRHSPGDGRLETLFSREGVQVLSVEADPRGVFAALVLNDRGSQALHLFRRRWSGGYAADRVLALPDGSVYDAAWSPDGRWIAFTADPGGSMNVYAADPVDGRIFRLTNSLYGAMEPAISPDGGRMVYIQLGKDRMDLVEAPFRPEEGLRVEAVDVASDPKPDPARPEAVAWSQPRPYRALSRLGPRMLYPILYAPASRLGAPHANLGWGFALAMQGTDPLQRWAWWAEGTLREGRGWGEVGIATAATVLRPVVRAYDRPTLATVARADGSGRRVVREKRGVEAAFGVPVLLSSNVRSSTASFGSGIRWEQSRHLDASMTPLDAFEGRLSATPFATLAVGVTRNLRDLVPNSGWTTLVAADVDVARGAGEPLRAVVASTSVYVPVLSRINGGLRIFGGLARQNRPDAIDLELFLPRGHEDTLVRSGWAWRYGSEMILPFAFVDNGSIAVPVFLQALYAYGFGEQVRDAARTRYTSVGGGMGARVRLFHVVDLDLRIGAARLVERGDWVVVYR